MRPAASVTVSRLVLDRKVYLHTYFPPNADTSPDTCEDRTSCGRMAARDVTIHFYTAIAQSHLQRWQRIPPEASAEASCALELTQTRLYMGVRMKQVRLVRRALA